MKRVRKFWPVLLVVVLILSVVLVRNHNNKALTKDGIAYFYQQENKNMEKVEKKIRTQLKARLEEAGENGDELIWSYFSETVIMGDSRAYGFMSYEFLPSNRVLAGAGDTIRKIDENIDAAKAMSPQYLILCYGLNDVSIGYWKNSDEYCEEFKEILEKLKKELPDTKIYVNSILPATEAGIAREGSWEKIPSYNKEVKKMCKEVDVGYIDASDLAKEHKDLYNDDGVHVARAFYPLWASVMMSTIYGE